MILTPLDLLALAAVYVVADQLSGILHMAVVQPYFMPGPEDIEEMMGEEQQGETLNAGSDIDLGELGVGPGSGGEDDE